MRHRLQLCVAFLSCCPAACVTSDDDFDRLADLAIRSDVPLWMENGTDAIAPRSFRTESTFGCVSGTSLGDWKQTFLPEPDGYQPEPVWWQVGMGGVIHCTGWFAKGQKRGATDLMLVEGGYTVNLGTDQATGLELYLWEIGVRTGSAYLVLSRRTDEEGNRFDVLDPRCVAGTVREAAPSSSILRTAYCAIPDQAAMRRIASEAASRPPIGAIEYIGKTGPEPA